MDGLKGVNDAFGHDEGDTLIVSCARVLKTAMGDRGVIGRMGGDEFAVVFFADDEEEGTKLQASMERLINEHNEKSEKPYLLSVSFGTFAFPFAKDIRIMDLLENADKKMYSVKESHRAGRRRGDFIENVKKTEE